MPSLGPSQFTFATLPLIAFISHKEQGARRFYQEQGQGLSEGGFESLFKGKNFVFDQRAVRHTSAHSNGGLGGGGAGQIDNFMELLRF